MPLSTTVFCPWASLTKAPRAKRLWPEVGDSWGPGLRCITLVEVCGCFHPEDPWLINIHGGYVLTCRVIHCSQEKLGNMFKSSSRLPCAKDHWLTRSWDATGFQGTKANSVMHACVGICYCQNIPTSESCILVTCAKSQHISSIEMR